MRDAENLDLNSCSEYRKKNHLRETKEEEMTVGVTEDESGYP